MSKARKFKRKQSQDYKRGYDEGFKDGHNSALENLKNAVAHDFYNVLKDEPGIGPATFEKIQNTLEKVGREL